MDWRSAQPRVGGSDRRVRGGTVGETARARGHRADRRWAIGCSLGSLGLLVPLDWVAGTLTAPRAALWSAGAGVVLAVLWPPRVTAGDGWLAVRTLLRTRRVRTDALVDVVRVGDVAVSLILRDVHGGRVELPPAILEANPLLWHAVDTGIRRSQQCGTLRSGHQAVDDLAGHVDAQAEHILRASGLS